MTTASCFTDKSNQLQSEHRCHRQETVQCFEEGTAVQTLEVWGPATDARKGWTLGRDKGWMKS